MDRKQYPLYTGLLKYFPDALMEVAHNSFVGNEKHNPGEPLHWSKEKSNDHEDAQMRHAADRAKGIIFDTDGVRHKTKIAWRALAALQTEIDNEKELREEATHTSTQEVLKEIMDAGII
jgi:hypothetical protein